MVVKCNPCLLLLFVFSASVAGPAVSSDFDVYKPEMRQLASIRLAKSVVEYGKAITACDQQRMVLPKTLFDAVALSAAEKGATLLYFSLRNQRRCSEPASRDFVLAVLQARALGLPGYSVSDDPVGMQMVLFALDPYVMELKREARYQLIPVEKRRQIERMPEIHQVFDFIPTVKAMNDE
ncbi:hypothetical protein HA052_23505 [Chromobacterium haemolyticum]|uniref:Uncharacterized protein n=1 Tax=Chromobacterium fluminis TaxID=3044269 RepID=A0ABX0LLX5_9NEIS|nr:hypothetical protein [Chromobacterium haemolyticum]NHR08162.1 hypothetical protein [Chromobacterium haemolyticum]